MARPLVICPLEIEAREIRREVGNRAEVVVGGLGARSGETASRRLAAPDPPSRIVLAGVCGGLTDPRPGAPGNAPGATHAEGHAVRVARVVSLEGESWRPAMVWRGHGGGADRGGAPTDHDSPVDSTLVGVDELIATPADKRALARRADAAYVDMESHHVARACVRAGIPWGVARGVSDDAGTALPPWLLGSITPDGRTRAWYSARNAMARPWQIPALLRIVAMTRQAAQAAGRAAAQMLDDAASAAGAVDTAGAASAASPAGAAGGASGSGGALVPVPSDAQRVLVVGGTFDPPHIGHIALAREAASAVGADWRLYIPAARSPFKSEGPAASDEDRLEMLRLAIMGEDRVSVSTVEMDRAKSALAELAAHGAQAHQREPSYTIDTLRALRRALPERMGLLLLIGADQAAEFHRWKEAREVIALAEPVVVLREPFTTPAALLGAMAPHWSPPEMERWRGRIARTSLTPASSTALRQSASGAAAGTSANGAWDRDVAPVVRAYIESRGLYGAMGRPAQPSP